MEMNLSEKRIAFRRPFFKTSISIIVLWHFFFVFLLFVKSVNGLDDIGTMRVKFHVKIQWKSESEKRAKKWKIKSVI